MRGIFITGTDTNVGKTFVSAILASWLRDKEKVVYWKPIQTGIESDDDTKTVKSLANLSDEEILDEGFRLEKPLSPHISAKLANVEITVAKTLKFANNILADKFLVAEGAGGVFVPLNDSELMIDLMIALKLPVVVVARSGLGTINHSLLTINILRNYGLKVLFVVMNGKINNDNKLSIERFGEINVMLQTPDYAVLSSEQIVSFQSQNPNFLTNFYEQLDRA